MAVTILSLGLVIAIQSFAISLRIAGTSLNLSRVALLAQRKLSEVELDGFSFESSNSGDFGENYPGFSWETEVFPVELEETTEALAEAEASLEDTPFLYQVAITIFWQERGHRRDLKFTTYLSKR